MTGIVLTTSAKNRASYSEDFIESFMDGPCLVLIGDRAQAHAQDMAGMGFRVAFVADRADQLVLPHRPSFGVVLLQYVGTLRRAVGSEGDRRRLNAFFEGLSFEPQPEKPIQVITTIGESTIGATLTWAFQTVEGAQIERAAIGLQRCFDRALKEF